MRNLSNLYISGDLSVDTNILHVDSTNNRVGVGTASPSNDILHVAGNIMMDGSILRMGSSTTKLVLQNVGGAWNSISAKGINIGDWNSDPSYGDILVGNYDFSVKNDALTSLVKVKNNGNVLIGTTTDNGYKLNVAGAISADGTINLGAGGSGSLQLNGVSVLSRTGTYTQIGNPEGAITLYLGDSADRTNYYDNNTHTFRSAGGGSTRFLINSSGNVGIGEVSVDARLHITSIGAVVNQKFESNGVAAWRMGIPNGQSYFAFDNSADDLTSPKMVLDSSGSVGIGTTSPTYKLDVNGGTSRITNAGYAGFEYHNTAGTWEVYIGTENNSGHARYNSRQGDHTWYANSFATMKLTSAGNVGIGTTSPETKLHIQETIAGNAGGMLYLKNSTESAGTYTGIYFGTWGKKSGIFHKQGSYGGYGKGDLIFATNTTLDGTIVSPSDARMVITNPGNVGVGTTSPSHKVDIYSNENVPLRIHRPSNANLDSSGAWGIGFSTRGDANTSTTDTRAGIFSYYNGNLFLAAANTSIVADPDAYARLTVTSGGYIGLGTMSPARPLHVSSASTSIIADFEYTAASYSTIQLTNTGGNAHVSSVNSDLLLSPGTTERMRVKSNGNVLIGTTTDSGYKLNVNGTTKIQAATSAALTFEQSSNVYQAAINSSAHLVLQSAANNQILFKGGGTTNMVIDGSTSNVGIGTTSPTSKLDVVGAIHSSTYVKSNYQSGFAIGSVSGVARIQTDASANVRFMSSGDVEFMRLSSTGNVGIGTTSPTEKLEVTGNVKLSSAGTGNSASSYNLLFYGTTSSGTQTDQAQLHSSPWATNSNGGNLHFYTSNASNILTERMRIDGNGYLGIGTTAPAGPLHVKYSSASLAGITIENDGVGNNAGSLTLRSGTSGGMNMSVTSTGGMYWYSLSNSSNALTLSSSNNLIINGAVDNGKKLQVNGDVFIKGSTSASSTKIFEVQNSSGTSIMDFRGDAYAFFGCGQGGGSASGFIFRYNDTSHVQFTGYNYGNGSGSYKPILLDTDLVGRGQGIYVNFGGTGYANPAPLSETEFAVRGRTADSSQKVAKFNDSNNNEVFSVRNDGAVFTQGSQGWNGTVNFPGNAPGQQNLQFVNGILVNVF